MSEQMEKRVLETPVGEAAFVSVFDTAKKTLPDGTKKDTEKYEITLVFVPERIAEGGPDREKYLALKKEAEAVEKNRWKKRPRKFFAAIRDGNDKVYVDKETGEEKVREGFEDREYIVLRSKFPPTIKGPDGETEITAEDGDKVFYSGCYARAHVTCFDWDNSGNNGVSFGLEDLQKVASGKRRGGGTRPPATPYNAVSEDDIAGLAADGDEDGDDPMA